MTASWEILIYHTDVCVSVRTHVSREGGGRVWKNVIRDK